MYDVYEDGKVQKVTACKDAFRQCSLCAPSHSSEIANRRLKEVSGLVRACIMHRRACIIAGTGFSSRAFAVERSQLTIEDARAVHRSPAHRPQLGHQVFLISCGHAALWPKSPC